MGFTPWKAEQPLRHIKLQEKKEGKDEKHTGKLFRKNLQIKVLAIEIMEEAQSNLEETGNPSILKNYFSSRTDPSIFALIASVLLDPSNKIN